MTNVNKGCRQCHTGLSVSVEPFSLAGRENIGVVFVMWKDTLILYEC